MLLYRLILTLFSPIVLGILFWRVLRRQETWGDLGERLGAGQGTPGAIWIHAASNGELTSAKRVIEAIQLRYGSIVVTSNTISGRALVQSWDLPVTARLAPLDARVVLARFSRAWRPRAFVIIENELWPNRIATFGGPILAVAARMSQRSASRWAKWPSLGRIVLGRIDALAPQDPKSGEFFRMLGLRQDALAAPIELKSSVAGQAMDARKLDEVYAWFDRQSTVLAASTHEGEDEVVVEAFQLAKVQFPGLRLIIAPRHPRRAKAIRELVLSQGLSVALRSANQPAHTDVYIADTMGEMGLWYSAAALCFVGGSLVPKGGHTPFEPTSFGSAVLTGPYVENFSDAYQGLVDAGAAVTVETVEALAHAFLGIRDPKATASMANAAAIALKTGSDTPPPSDQALAILDRLLA